jgi:hypothetical protein
VGKKIYRYWPISLRWAWSGIADPWRKEVPLRTRIAMGFRKYSPPRCWFDWHGIEDTNGECYWVYHLGPIKVIFGEK